MKAVAKGVWWGGERRGGDVLEVVVEGGGLEAEGDAAGIMVDYLLSHWKISHVFCVVLFPRRGCG